jgi:hypothetical protein
MVRSRGRVAINGRLYNRVMPNLKGLFMLDQNATFLNLGSFGATPEPVIQEDQCWKHELERQPWSSWAAVHGPDGRGAHAVGRIPRDARRSPGLHSKCHHRSQHRGAFARPGAGGRSPWQRSRVRRAGLHLAVLAEGARFPPYQPGPSAAAASQDPIRGRVLERGQSTHARNLSGSHHASHRAHFPGGGDRLAP